MVKPSPAPSDNEAAPLPKKRRSRARAANEVSPLPLAAPDTSHIVDVPEASGRVPGLGRPSEFTPEIATTICVELMDGRSLRSICEDADMPATTTVYRWLHERDDFRDQYARAREIQAEGGIDDMIEIADDGRNDWMLRAQGGYQVNGEVLARSKLRIETRQWAAMKLLPKKYGDKLQIDANHAIAAMDDAELAAEILIQMRALGLAPPAAA